MILDLKRKDQDIDQMKDFQMWTELKLSQTIALKLIAKLNLAKFLN